MMPLFYHFELNEVFTKVYNITNQLGLSIRSKRAIAALAISLLCFGIANRSIKSCAISWFVCAFSFLVKPSGLLIMMALLRAATVEFVVCLFGTHSNRGAAEICVTRIWRCKSVCYSARNLANEKNLGRGAL
jgi:hypothetical protein